MAETADATYLESINAATPVSATRMRVTATARAPAFRADGCGAAMTGRIRAGTAAVRHRMYPSRVFAPRVTTTSNAGNNDNVSANSGAAASRSATRGGRARPRSSTHAHGTAFHLTHCCRSSPTSVNICRRTGLVESGLSNEHIIEPPSRTVRGPGDSKSTRMRAWRPPSSGSNHGTGPIRSCRVHCSTIAFKSATPPVCTRACLLFQSICVNGRITSPTVSHRPSLDVQPRCRLSSIDRQPVDRAWTSPLPRLGRAEVLMSQPAVQPLAALASSGHHVPTTMDAFVTAKRVLQ